MPGDLVDRIKFAMSIASLEAQVAEIVSESAMASVRVAHSNRADTVTFASDGLSVMVTIEHSGDGSRRHRRVGQRGQPRGGAPRARTHPDHRRRTTTDGSPSWGWSAVWSTSS